MIEDEFLREFPDGICSGTFPFFCTEEEENEYYKKQEEERLEFNKNFIKSFSPKVIIIKYLPFPENIVAINLFDMVFAKRQLSEIELRHETIHSLQMRRLGIFKFYFRYIREWIKNYKEYKDLYVAYTNISYEKDACTYQDDVNNLVDRYIGRIK